MVRTRPCTRPCTRRTARLTDGFGEFTAAVPGFRTVRRTRAQPLPIDAAGEDLAEPMAENDEMNAAEKAEVRRRVRTQQLRAEAAAVEVVPVIPRTLPVRLQRQPTGSGPPFVYVPGCYESAADSEIRATSILEDDELDKVGGYGAQRRATEMVKLYVHSAHASTFLQTLT